MNVAHFIPAQEEVPEPFDEEVFEAGCEAAVIRVRLDHLGPKPLADPEGPGREDCGFVSSILGGGGSAN